MNPKVVAKGLVSLFVRRYAGPFWFRRRQLVRTQWLDGPSLEALQWRRLKRLIEHCYATVPFYGRVMRQHDLTPDSIQSLADIEKMPIIAKQDVLQAGDDIVSTKFPAWKRRQTSTSGTTGTPMPIYRGLFSIGDEHAFVRRQWDWAGVGMRDACAYLKGRVFTRIDQQTDHLHIYDPVMKELHLSTYHLSPEIVPTYVEIIKRHGVKALVGYPSSLYSVAKTCLDRKISLKLGAVLSTSEVLMPPYREAISQAFGCDVFDFYGSAERVCYIFTCEHGRYHIQPEYGLTELIPVEGEQEGCCRVVATGFWSTAMPLVRYDTGDRVIRSQEESCPCGRAFPMVERIIGRQGDTIVTPSGRQLGTSLVTHMVYVICGADHFLESQVIQDAPDHITIAYVPDGQCTPEELARFEERLQKNLPHDLRCSLKEVDAVERTRSGKIKPIVSKLPRENGGRCPTSAHAE